MKEDLLLFLTGVSLLVLYLIFSAMTEMGTRWPVEKVRHNKYQFSTNLVFKKY